MKTILAAAVIVTLVAAVAWALAGSRPAGSPYVVEISAVAGAKSFVVSPVVEVTASWPGLMDEVVARANLMPEVVVRAPAATELAAVPAAGREAVN